MNVKKDLESLKGNRDAVCKDLIEFEKEATDQ